MSTTGTEKKYYGVLLVVWILYATISLLAPQNPVNTYNLSVTQINLLKLSLMIPTLVIWFIVLYAILKIKQYTKTLYGNQEEPWFKNITKGLSVLLVGLILPSFISLISAYDPLNNALKIGSRVTTNYIAVVVAILAFWFLLQGSKGFLSLLQQKTRYTVVVLLTLILAAVYGYNVFNNDFRTSSDVSAIQATYNLPDALIVLTIMIPYVIAWFFGLTAIQNIRTFARNAPGLIYRKAFSLVAIGIVFIVSLSIISQLISQFGSLFAKVQLSTILIIVYALLLLILVGYIYVARGARELLKIETV